MKAVRRAWRAFGFASDTSFLIAAIGGVATLGAIGAGLLAELTAISTGFLVVASAGLVTVLAVLVPMAMMQLRGVLGGARLTVGEWEVHHRLTNRNAIAEASVAIWNARETGGERVKARGVVPQLEIFSLSGRRLYHHVGWSTINKRDFPATREEERIKLAEQAGEDGHYLLGHCSPLFYCTEPLVEGRLTLRGDNLAKPVVATFTLGLDGNGRLWVKGAD